MTSRFKLLNVQVDHAVADEHGWRTFVLDAEGDTSADLYAGATLTAIDKDGAEFGVYRMDEVDMETRFRACEAIDRARMRASA